MGKPEGAIETYLTDRVKEEGGKVRKVVFPGRSGAPDRLIWFPHRPFVFVEVKAPGKRVDDRSPQGREIRDMRKDGMPVFVINSREQADDIVQRAKRG